MLNAGTATAATLLTDAQTKASESESLNTSGYVSGSNVSMVSILLHVLERRPKAHVSRVTLLALSPRPLQTL